jgi:hypothetical protein
VSEPLVDEEKALKIEAAKNGRIDVTYRHRAEASVFLRKPAFVVRGSGHIAELCIVVENSEIAAKLNREELKKLAEMAEHLLAVEVKK